MSEKSMLREPTPLDEDIKETRCPSKNTTSLYKIFPYLYRHPKSLIFSVFSILLASLTLLGIGSVLRFFVDRGFSSEGSLGLAGALSLFFLVISVMTLASYGRLYWVSQLSESVIAELRKDVFSSLLTQNVTFFDFTPLGEIQSRITTDTTLLQIVLSTSLPIGMRNILIIVGGLGLLMMTSFFLTLLIVGITPFVLIPLLLYSRKVRHYSREVQGKTALVSARLEDTFGAIRTVFAFCREAYMTSLFADQVDATYRMALKRIKARARLTALVMVLVFAAISCVLWYGGQNVIRGQMTAGELSAFLFYAVAVAGAAGSLSEIYGDILRAAGGTERIFEFIDLALHPKPPSPFLTLPSPLKGHIQFLDVTFAYPSQPSRLVLKDLNFEATKGDVIAITGPSGIGKTTIFNLLMCFYPPLKGQIFLDGVPLNEMSPQALREVIGFVPQDPVIFRGTFLDNIRFGKLDATLEEVKAAAVAAYADAFIEATPLGYHTPLGEKGITLSGGQRQRIAIARALIKNPPILLLDEATSALDSESEAKIQEALKALRPDRTTLIIAHRKSTIQEATRILKLKG